MFIDALLEKNSQASFAKEQDRLKMMRILHVANVESGNGKKLDLELLFNQIGGIFKLDEEAPEEDASLQAALLAQVCKANYENRGAAAQDLTNPKKNQDSRSPRSGPPDISKLTQLVLDMKAEMGSMSKAMIRSGISLDRSPN